MNQFGKKTKKTWKSDPQEPKEEPNPDADTDVDDSSDDEEEKNVKHDPDKVIKTEDGDIKQDPDQPAKLETGQRENETLAEFKLRWVRGSTDQNRRVSQYLRVTSCGHHLPYYEY